MFTLEVCTQQGCGSEDAAWAWGGGRVLLAGMNCGDTHFYVTQPCITRCPTPQQISHLPLSHILPFLTHVQIQYMYLSVLLQGLKQPVVPIPSHTFSHTRATCGRRLKQNMHLTHWLQVEADDEPLRISAVSCGDAAAALIHGCWEGMYGRGQQAGQKEKGGAGQAGQKEKGGAGQAGQTGHKDKGSAGQARSLYRSSDEFLELVKQVGYAGGGVLKLRNMFGRGPSGKKQKTPPAPTDQIKSRQAAICRTCPTWARGSAAASNTMDRGSPLRRLRQPK